MALKYTHTLLGAGSCDLSTTPKYYAMSGDCVLCPEDPGVVMIVISMAAIAAFMFVLSHLTAVTPDADNGGVKVLGKTFSGEYWQRDLILTCLSESG